MEKPAIIFNRLFWKLTFLFLALLLIIGSFPFLFTQFSVFGLDFNQTGEIGDTLGGILGPFVAMVAAFLTFIAFWIQYDANQQQRNLADQQRKDIKVERFEAKFYEMLRLHRANVDEMEITNERHQLRGRKLLMRMFYEFKFIYFAFKQQSEEEFEDRFSPERIVELSFKLFLHGLGNNAKESVNEKLEGDELKLFESVASYLETSVRLPMRDHLRTSDPTGYFEYPITLTNGKSFTGKFLYQPFEGHTNRLPHYYRQLYQLAQFIIRDNSLELTHEQKYDYIRLIRAQLSNFEQLLLYYNSFAYGRAWIRDNILTDYKLIKNLPLNQADFGVHPHQKLGTKNRFDEFIFQDDE